MFGFLKRLFRKKKGTEGSGASVDYEHQKKIAFSGDLDARLALAKNPETSPELLYYMAEKDVSAKVRKAVADNERLPVQAGGVLAQDADQDVRLVLAQRLMTLLPELSKDQHSQLYAYAVQALGTLALDEVLKIRKTLSATLKDMACTPPKIAGQLARDVEREVSEPILRECAALADEDLLDILAGHPECWAVQAIAGRPQLAQQVSQAVIDAEDIEGGRILLENKGADISEKALVQVVEMARAFPEWQGAVASRASLPEKLALRLAEFADESVRDILGQRTDFDPDTIEEIAQAFRRRLDYKPAAEDSEEAVAEKVIQLHKDGNLDEKTVSDALALQDREFVIMALALLAKTDRDTVKRIISVGTPKPVIALCWGAGLSMRFALEVEKSLARIPAQELVYPRGGTDYPLTDDEMLWQLEFFGLKAA